MPTVLRLLGATLAALAGALLAGGTFPALVSVEYRFWTYRLSGWSEDWGGDSGEYGLVLGLPLVVGAGGLLVAAVLAASSEWLPRARRAGLVVTLAAVSFAVGQVWVAASYATDWVQEPAALGESVQPQRGAGYWLLLSAVLLAVLSAGCLGLSQVGFRRRPVSTAAVGGGPVAPPGPSLAQSQWQSNTGPADAPWSGRRSPWGGQQ